MEQKQEEDLCNSCQRDGKVSSATVFCLPCSERLCEQCKKHHKMNKASSSHKTMSITNVKDVEALNTLKRLTQCPVHQAKNIKYLCKDHDQLCCNECAIVRHRKCENVVSLVEEIERTTKQGSPSTEEVLKELDNHADLLLRHEETEQLKIESTTEVCVKALATLKKNVEDAYNGLAYKITEDAKKGRDDITRKITSEKVEIQMYKTNLHKSILKLETVKGVGQEVHMYLTERELRNEVNAYKEKLKVLREQANNKNLVIQECSSEKALEINVCLKKVIDVRTEIVDPILPVCKVTGLRALYPSKRHEFPLQLQKQIDRRRDMYYLMMQTAPVCVYGCLWLNNCLVVLRDNHDIVLIDTNGKHKMIETDLRRLDKAIMTKVDDRTLAIAHNCNIRLVQLDPSCKQLHRDRQFSLTKHVLGMAYDTGLQALVILAHSGRVEFLNTEGKEVASFTLNNLQHVSKSSGNMKLFTLFDSDSKILYTADKSSLIATTMESSQVFEYKLTESLVASPALDADGNIYIPIQIGDQSVIQQINQKGELIRSIQISACALNFIMVCFNTEMDTFIALCDDKDKELKFFDLVS